ncbi:MAG: hypothetical protein V4650_09400 [Pseudomonadota bacterium]
MRGQLNMSGSTTLPAPAAWTRREVLCAVVVGGVTTLLSPATYADGGAAAVRVDWVPGGRSFVLGLPGAASAEGVLRIGVANDSFVLVHRDAPVHRQLSSQASGVHLSSAWQVSEQTFAVLDGGRGALHRFRFDGSPLDAAPLCGVAAAGDGCADGTGGSYVSLTRRHTIAHLAADGRVLREFGGQHELNSPTGLVRLADGDLVVADTGNRRLRRYSAAGNLRGTMTQFEFMPRHLAVSDATLATYDPLGARAVLMDLHGTARRDVSHPAGIEGRCTALSAGAGGQLFASA